MTAHHRTNEWRALITELRPIYRAAIRNGNARCVDCGKPITEGQAFDVGHRVGVAEGKAQGWTRQMLDSPTNLGPSHRGCNRSAGGKVGAKISNTKRTEGKRHLPW